MKIKLLLFVFILYGAIDIVADVDFGGQQSREQQEVQQNYYTVLNEQTQNKLRARLEKKPYAPLSENEMVAEAASRFMQKNNENVPPNTRINIGQNMRPVNVQQFQSQPYLNKRLQESPSQEAARKTTAAKYWAQLKAATKKVGSKQPVVSQPKPVSAPAPKPVQSKPVVQQTKVNVSVPSQHPVQPSKPTVSAQKKPVATAKSSHPQPPRATQPQPPKATHPQSTKKIQH